MTETRRRRSTARGLELQKIIEDEVFKWERTLGDIRELKWKEDENEESDKEGPSNH